MKKKIDESKLTSQERYFLRKSRKEGWSEKYTNKLLTKEQEGGNHGENA